MLSWFHLSCGDFAIIQAGSFMVVVLVVVIIVPLIRWMWSKRSRKKRGLDERRSWLNFLVLFLCLAVVAGCATIKPLKKQTTTYYPDGSQTVIDEEVYPAEVSPQVAAMVQACYESFGKRAEIPVDVLNAMDSSDIKDYLQFREHGLRLQEAYGYTPDQVCRTPVTIYQYALAHDEALFSAIKEPFIAIINQTPWLASLGMVSKLAKVAGDHIGGDQTAVGRDNQVAGRDLSQAEISNQDTKTQTFDITKNDSSKKSIGF